jgi:hypothetical protein
VSSVDRGVGICRPRAFAAPPRGRALEHRLLGDSSIGRIAQTAHQLVVLGLRLVFFLLQPMEDDIGIRDALEPGEAAFDFLRIGSGAGRGLNALGPAGSVFLFLFHQSIKDVAPFRIRSRSARCR